MIYQITHSGNDFQELLYYAREFVVNNGIKDVLKFDVSQVVDPDSQEVLGYTSLMFYTKQ